MEFKERRTSCRLMKARSAVAVVGSAGGSSGWTGAEAVCGAQGRLGGVWAAAGPAGSAHQPSCTLYDESPSKVKRTTGLTARGKVKAGFIRIKLLCNLPCS